MSKRHSVLKTALGLALAAGAAKIGYDQYKKTKEKFADSEQESESDLIHKYNTLFERRVVEADDDIFQGCEINASGAHFILDLGRAKFTKDVYISLSAKCSSVKIILPQGVSAQCDVTETASKVSNYAENPDDETQFRIYIIGDALCSSIEVIPMSFYADDDFDVDEDGSVAGQTEQDTSKESTQAAEKDEAADSKEESDDLEVDEVKKD